MQYVGTFNVCRNAPPSSPINRTDPIHLKIKERWEKALDVERMAQHTSAINDVPRYIKSLKKCDKLPVKPKDSAWALAQEYTYQMLKPICGDCGSSTKVDYNPHASNGVPGNRIINPETGQPFKNKGEFFNSPIGQQMVKELYIPLFQVSGKVEFLPLDEVTQDEKMRTFFCGDSAFVMKQKLMYDKMDEAMLNNAENFQHCWSRYGFTRQYGGFHRLVSAHVNNLRFRNKRLFFKTSDVSGWDRLLPIMPEIYKLRKRLYGRMTPLEEQYHDYIAENICDPYCCLFNGDVIQRHCGNVSGSGKTTSDNTIGHIMLEMYVFISLYYEKHGSFPSFDYIIDNTVESLYGDDDFGTLILDDWCPEDMSDEEQADYFIQKYREYYARFGLVIKEKAFKGQFDTPQGMEFLGGSFVKTRVGRWGGAPRYSKIATSLTQILEKNRDIIQYVSILDAALSMLVDIEDGEAILLNEYLVEYAREITKMHDFITLPQRLKFFVASVVSLDYSGQCIMHGFESFQQNDLEKATIRNWDLGVFASLQDDFFFYTPQGRDRVGFKSEEMKSQVKNYKGLVLEYCSKTRQKLSQPIYKKIGPDHMPTFLATVVFGGVEYTGQGFNKTDADQKCFAHIYSVINTKKYSKDIASVQPRSNEVRWDTEDSLDIYSIDWEKPPGTKYLRVVESPPTPEVRHIPVRSKIVETHTPAVISRKPITPPVSTETEIFNEDFDDIYYYQSQAYQKRYNHYQRLDDEFIVVDETLVKNFFLGLATQLKTNQWDLFSKIDDKSISELATWLHMKFKEGSFNPYGNGQTTNQYTLTKPSFKHIGEQWTCTSTCLLPSPINILGSGETQQLAFADWLDQITDRVDLWCPVDTRPVKAMFNHLMSLEIPEDHELYQFVNSSLPEEQRFKSFWDTFFPGGYNPYGNGQPTMSYEQYASQPSMKGKPKQEVERRYNAMVARTTRKNKNKNQSLKVVVPKKKKPNLPMVSTMKGAPDSGLRLGSKGQFSLSPCAENYGLCVICPFYLKTQECEYKTRGLKHKKEKPCIPTYPPIKSLKNFFYAEGEFGSAAQVPQIIFAPWRLANNNDPDTDVSCPILFTTSAAPSYGNTFITCDTGAASTVSGVSLNTPYSTASLISGAGAEGLKYRVVSAGLGVQHYGSLINRSGIYVGYVQEDHLTVSEMTQTEASQYNGYTTKTVEEVADEGGWFEIVYTSVNPTDYDYLADPVANANWNTDPYHNHFMGIMVPGGTSGGNFFRWRAIVHFEIIGRTAMGKTDTKSDPVGLAVVSNAMTPDLQAKVNTKEPVKSILNSGTGDVSLTKIVDTVASVANVVSKFA